MYDSILQKELASCISLMWAGERTVVNSSFPFTTIIAFIIFSQTFCDEALLFYQLIPLRNKSKDFSLFDLKIETSKEPIATTQPLSLSKPHCNCEPPLSESLFQVLKNRLYKAGLNNHWHFCFFFPSSLQRCQYSRPPSTSEACSYHHL